jgi:hypothetical protein
LHHPAGRGAVLAQKPGASGQNCTPGGNQWIHIPVNPEDRRKPVSQIRIDQEKDWITPLLRSLEYNYRNSIYYDFYEPEIKDWFKSAESYSQLLPFILHFREQLFSLLGISVDFTLASELENYTSDPDQLAQQLGADVLFQESGSRHYQRQAARRRDPIFIHPVYYQHFAGFEPDCCLLDVLFQSGPENFRIIDHLKG